MIFVFFACFFVVVYTYLIYPAAILVWGKFAPKRIEKRYNALPVSVVIAARNEEINIKVRIENILAQDYPSELIEVIVVSDNSSDRTVEVARGVGDKRVRVFEAGAPGGKSAAINRGVSEASNEIVVFADARQRFGDNVLAELTAILNDPSVGAASGELVIRPAAGSDISEGVGLYWRYEKLIRRMESAVDSVVGATGSIYAIRRSLFTPLEPTALLDDFLVPMRIVLGGHRVLFVRSALAFDVASSGAGREFSRKVRTLAGNFQAMAFEKRLLNPARNRLFFQFVSHKVARLFVPYCCLGALLASGLAGGVLGWVFAAQVAFYATSALNFTPVSRTRVGGVVRVAWTFVVLNAAAVAGLWIFAAGRSAGTWKES